MEKISFPQYRKYPHKKTFFRIISTDFFEELNIIGSYYTLRFFKAEILPDRVFMEDMIQNKNGYWELSDEKEFNEILEFCEKKLKKLS
jgi:hypothetical protein